MDEFLDYWEKKLEIDVEEAAELDPEATGIELLELLDQRREELLRVIKQQYEQQLLHADTDESIKACIDELDKELAQSNQLTTAQIKTEIIKQNTAINAALQGAFYLDKENQRVDNMLRKVEAVSKQQTLKPLSQRQHLSKTEHRDPVHSHNTAVDQQQVAASLEKYVREDRHFVRDAIKSVCAHHKPHTRSPVDSSSQAETTTLDAGSSLLQRTPPPLRASTSQKRFEEPRYRANKLHRSVLECVSGIEDVLSRGEQLLE